MKEDERAIDDLAKELVGDLKPAEAAEEEVMQAVSESFWADPARYVETKPADKQLGSGVVLATVFTTVALSVCKQVFDFLLAEVQKNLAAESKELIKQKMTALFLKATGGKQAHGEVLKLTTEQLRLVNDKAKASALRLGLDKNEAEELADGIVSRLAIE